jgi:hypothetical protein
MDHAGRIIERVVVNDQPGMSGDTATISARGTMIRSTRVSRMPRIFLSIAASSGEKPDSGCSAVRTCSRSARVAAAFQPNRMRMTRASQPSGCSLACGTTIGRPLCSLSAGSLRVGDCDIDISFRLGVQVLAGRLA